MMKYYLLIFLSLLCMGFSFKEIKSEEGDPLQVIINHTEHTVMVQRVSSGQKFFIPSYQQLDSEFFDSKIILSIENEVACEWHPTTPAYKMHLKSLHVEKLNRFGMKWVCREEYERY